MAMMLSKQVAGKRKRHRPHPFFRSVSVVFSSAISMKYHLLPLVALALLTAFSGREAALAYWRAQPAVSVPGFLQGDPAFAVRRADADLAQAMPPAAVDIRKMRANAMAAIRAEPLNAAAMRQFGMAMALSGKGSGQEQFALAERISRRDPLDQFLLIDTSAHMGDVANTLAHYDRLLSVNPEVGETLYPILASAVSDDTINAALAEHADRRWFLRLIGAAIDADTKSAAVSGMLAAARLHWRAADLEPLYTRLLGRLVKRGQYAEAGAFARQMPGVPADALEYIGFSAATTDTRLAPLSWALARQNAVQAEIDGHGGLAVRLASEQSAIVAERVTLLTPGTYELIQRVAYAADSPRARLHWQIRCLGSEATPVWRQPVPLRKGQVTYLSRFTVPQACEAQRWRLQATADVTQADSMACLARIALVKR